MSIQNIPSLVSAYFLGLFFLSMPGFASNVELDLMNDELQTVEYVDLERYQGRWFEIASFPQWFSRGCKNTQATYTLRSDGKVDVLNECEKSKFFGNGTRISRAKGVARVVDEVSQSKLKVRFGLSPVEGDYWIIELGAEYDYVVVSGPSRDALWILSRTKELDGEQLKEILDRLTTVHKLDVSKLEWTRTDIPSASLQQ